MDSNFGAEIRAITVAVRFNNEDGEKESRYPGYLTGGDNAMYADEYGNLIFAEIKSTEDPDIYLDVSGWTQLGNIRDGGGDLEAIVSKLTSKLHNMTGYDFVANVMIHVREGFDYEGAIIPNLINEKEQCQ